MWAYKIPDDWFLWLVLIAIMAFFIHCPILKPWFGFRRPPGAKGRWFQ